MGGASLFLMRPCPVRANCEVLVVDRVIAEEHAFGWNAKVSCVVTVGASRDKGGIASGDYAPLDCFPPATSWCVVGLTRRHHDYADACLPRPRNRCDAFSK